jgi:hypothetical protein
VTSTEHGTAPIGSLGEDHTEPSNPSFDDTSADCPPAPSAAAVSARPGAVGVASLADDQRRATGAACGAAIDVPLPRRSRSRATADNPTALRSARSCWSEGIVDALAAVTAKK